MENKNEQNMMDEENTMNSYQDFAQYSFKKRAPFLIVLGILFTLIGTANFIVGVNQEEIDFVALLIAVMGVMVGLLLSVGSIRFLIKTKKHQENA